MALVKVNVTTREGNTKGFQKLAVFAETDEKGRIFMKLEGQDNEMRTGIAFHYDRNEGIEHIVDVIQDFLDRQVETLKKG